MRCKNVKARITILVLLSIHAMFIECKEHYDKNFEKCSVRLDMDITNGECSASEVPNCTAFRVCQKTFNIVHLERKPYSPQIVSDDLLRACCGDCVKVNNITMVKKISRIPENVKNKIHLIFPVLGRRDAPTMHG